MERSVNEFPATTTGDLGTILLAHDSPAAGHSPSRSSSGMRSSVAIVAFAWLVVGVVAVALNADAITGFAARQIGPVIDAARSGAAVAGEDPGNEPGSPLCNDVGAGHAVRLNRGLALMRRTGEGAQLYREMIDNDVCITVRVLGDWAGVWLPRPTLTGTWKHSTIEIDREHLETVGPDVLATTLVHEAAHMDRDVRGLTCAATDSCTVFDNDVVLEEEVAAHAAEARCWIAFYGRDGKDDAEGEAAWQNALAAAYLAGPAVFTDYVAAMRIDDPTLSTSR